MTRLKEITARQILDSKITEKQFTQQVIQLLLTCGFDFVYHTFNSLHSPRGFPDLIALRVRDKRLLFAELKSDKGVLLAEQADWINALREIGCEAHLWRPSDWESIVGICSRSHPYREESI